jgi:hypothetical protein
MDAIARLPRTTRQRHLGLAVPWLVMVALTVVGCAEDPEAATPPAGRASSPTPTPGSSPATGPTLSRATLTSNWPGDWATEIPERLRLDTGMPRSDSDQRAAEESVLQQVELCESGTLLAGQPVDEQLVAVSGPEYGEFRAVRLYVDQEAAVAAYRTVVERARACPRRTMPGGTTWHHRVWRGELGGARSTTIVQTYEVDGMVVIGASWWRLIRVGNALLLTGTSGEAMPGQTLRLSLREQARAVEPVVAEVTATFGR